jgi:SAM-dependent methyltransferase
LISKIRFQGAGPGPQAPDGCSVELWKLLPPGSEPSLIASAVPAGGSVLELGAGVGRITHPLLELGYVVTAVDNSPEMLAEIRGAKTVLCDIEGLALERSFDAVVLGSFLIRAPAPGTRAALLATCRRHVTADGGVLIQHHREDWLAGVTPGLTPGFMGAKDGIECFVEDARHEGRLVHMTLRYETVTGTWTHDFTVETLPRSEMRDALTQVGLSFARYLDEQQTWLVARRR